MQVPFVKAIAEHFPPPVRAQDPLSAPIWSLDQLPDAVRQRLASAAGVAIDALTPESLSSIQRLDLARLPITSRDLTHLARGLQLEDFDLSGCTGLTYLTGLSGLKSLEGLWLQDCTGLKGHGVLKALTGLTQLTELDISGCTGLTDLAGLETLKSLEGLWMSRCTGLQEAEVWKALAGLDQLSELNLSGCTGLHSTQCLLPLQALRKLVLQNCTRLQGLDALAGLVNLNQLEFLDLYGCTLLTAEDIAAFRREVFARRGPKGLKLNIHEP